MKKLFLTIAAVLMFVFSTIAFAELVDKATIKGQEIYVGQMQAEALGKLGAPDKTQPSYYVERVLIYFYGEYYVSMRDGIVYQIGRDDKKE